MPSIPVLRRVAAPDAVSIRTRQNRAPSYAELRPVKGPSPQSFPIYEHLVDDLVDDAPRTYSAVTAHVCAVASGWAYADADTAAAMTARLGLERAWYREVSVYNDAMFIASNALLIQSACGRVAILCYRGTEPRNFINWLTDADVNPVKLPVKGGAPEELVHGGFYRNLRATWHEVIAGLKRATAGKPVVDDADEQLKPLQALYITGHSLGAAMAALAAMRIARDPVYDALFGPVLRAVYTFGQPLLGNRAFAKACRSDAFLEHAVFRHVYADDVVPRLPPTTTGTFEHFGREYRAEPDGRWRESRTSVVQVRDIVLSALVVPVLAFVGKQLQFLKRFRFPYSWYDHSPTFYIAASTPPGVGSEFERSTSELTSAARGPEAIAAAHR